MSFGVYSVASPVIHNIMPMAFIKAVFFRNNNRIIVPLRTCTGEKKKN